MPIVPPVSLRKGHETSQGKGQRHTVNAMNGALDQSDREPKSRDRKAALKGTFSSSAMQATNHAHLPSSKPAVVEDPLTAPRDYDPTVGSGPVGSGPGGGSC
jgi:hypothetical protein